MPFQPIAYKFAGAMPKKDVREVRWIYRHSDYSTEGALALALGQKAVPTPAQQADGNARLANEAGALQVVRLALRLRCPCHATTG